MIILVFGYIILCIIIYFLSLPIVICECYLKHKLVINYIIYYRVSFKNKYGCYVNIILVLDWNQFKRILIIIMMAIQTLINITWLGVQRRSKPRCNHDDLGEDIQPLTTARTNPIYLSSKLQLYITIILLSCVLLLNFVFI